MLVNTGHEERAAGQRYEAMQCFALTQPRAMMEEGEGESTKQKNNNFFLQRSREMFFIAECVIVFAVLLLLCSLINKDRALKIVPTETNALKNIIKLS